MDTTNSIIAYARVRTNSNTYSYTTANALLNLENRYRRVISAINSKVQTYFWTWGISDLVANQTEYTIDSFTFPDTTTRDITNIDKVSVKYTSTSDFLPLEKSSFYSLTDDWANYANYAWTPFYFIRDNSVFIAPWVTTWVTNGFKIYGSYRPQNLTASDSTTEIKTPALYNYILAEGICADYWESQLKSNQAQVFEQRFETWLKALIEWLSNRDRDVFWYEVSVNPYH